MDWGSDATRVEDRRASLEQALAKVPQDVVAVAHRVVHGGTRFQGPTLVDDGVLDELDQLSDLAPLHNPVAVDTIRAQRALRPDLPCVALFDSAFHATLEEDAYVYPLPYSWYSEWGIRRFGFHGLSVEWSVGRAAELLSNRADRLSLIVAHLGSGCSVTAVRHGRSVWTSMGFTPLEGLAMGTRSGSVDPARCFTRCANAASRRMTWKRSSTTNSASRRVGDDQRRASAHRCRSWGQRTCPARTGHLRKARG